MGEVVKMLYRNGYYQDDELQLFMDVGWLTVDDYQELTGKEY